MTIGDIVTIPGSARMLVVDVFIHPVTRTWWATAAFPHSRPGRRPHEMSGPQPLFTIVGRARA